MASSQRSPRMRKFSQFVDTRSNPLPVIKRFDGAARSCADWDHLRRDPELWVRNGNCLIYLYGKGDSRRGPSFRIPINTLIDAKCFPLIERFLVWEGIRTPTAYELGRWAERNPTRRIELYIPAPPNADRLQAFQFHVSIRNFFAWLLRRSLVGNSLGTAAVALLYSMLDYRSEVDDNVSDMMEYFDEEGYLDMTNQPTHALAMLYLSELFQVDALYTKAFAHCVGMSEHLLGTTEYAFITLESRKLIRRARLEMESRLGQCSGMLRTFLDEELSEAHLSVSAGARAHLQRFRGFLLSFYTTKLGYYPPHPGDSRNNWFDPNILRAMREDFEALYDLLVDDQYTSSQTMATEAYGGICTMQLVHSFDALHNYTTLRHPMPLIPKPSASSRRISWLPGSNKLKSDRRVTAHAALIKASNIMKPGVMQNALVRAYRRFEEECITSPNKSEKLDKVSMVDARKVRWILIYGLYQVLRSATEMPTNVEKDADEAGYSLSVSMINVPPWKRTRQMERILQPQPDLSRADFQEEEQRGRIEIKPDIDYFALTHKEQSPLVERRCSSLGFSECRSAGPSRSNSLTRALSRSSAVRKSMRMFGAGPGTPPPTANSQQSRLAYHEIVVHGYGNGTNDVNFDMDGSYMDTTTWPDTSRSTSPKLDDRGGSTPDSMESADETLDSTSSAAATPPPPPMAFLLEDPNLHVEKRKSRRQRRREVVSMVTQSVSVRIAKRRPLSATFTSSPKLPDLDDDMVQEQEQEPQPQPQPQEESQEEVQHELQPQKQDEDDEQTPQTPAPPQRTSSFGRIHPGLPRSFTRHSLVLPDLRRKSSAPTATRRMSMPVRAIDRVRSPEATDSEDEPYIISEEADWLAMQTFMDPDALEGGAMPAWEQYAELGGLTDMR